MIPLAMASAGDKVLVARIGGNEDAKKHLEDLGFVVGAQVTVVADTGDGNIIVNLKDSRLAITSQMATKIMVD
ncbi:MAG: FeoA family protein [Eubacteriales bacterium]